MAGSRALPFDRGCRGGSFCRPGADPVASGQMSAGILQRAGKLEDRGSEHLICSARSLPPLRPTAPAQVPVG